MEAGWNIGDKVAIPKETEMLLHENGRPFLMYDNFEKEIKESGYPLDYLVITNNYIPI